MASLQLANRLASITATLSTILDCGANVGQFARAVAETYPDARIISFEPLENAARPYRKNLADRHNVELIQSAVGDTDGELTFYPNAYDQSSSALKVTERFRSTFPDSLEKNAIWVPVTRLDTFAMNRQLSRPLLLKLDLQGYELNALKGAVNLLQQTDYVLTETVFQQMYEGEPLFQDIADFLKTVGFRFLEPLTFLRDRSGRIVQMDALFRRQECRPDSR